MWVKQNLWLNKGGARVGFFKTTCNVHVNSKDRFSEKKFTRIPRIIPARAHVSNLEICRRGWKATTASYMCILYYREPSISPQNCSLAIQFNRRNAVSANMFRPPPLPLYQASTYVLYVYTYVYVRNKRLAPPTATPHWLIKRVFLSLHLQRIEFPFRVQLNKRTSMQAGGLIRSWLTLPRVSSFFICAQTIRIPSGWCARTFNALLDSVYSLWNKHDRSSLRQYLLVSSTALCSFLKTKGWLLLSVYCCDKCVLCSLFFLIKKFFFSTVVSAI